MGIAETFKGRMLDTEWVRTYLSLLLIAFVLASPSVNAQELAVQQLGFVNEYIEKFGEESILRGSEVYRIVIWPTFHNPIMVQVEMNGTELKLTAKKLSGQGGYEVGGIEKSTVVPINEKQFAGVRKLVQESGLTGMPTRETRFDGKPGEMNMEICLDGSHWIIQTLIDGKSHSVVRYCPEDEKLHRIGLELVKMSKLKVKRSELF
jgi:hypothetical protein